MMLLTQEKVRAYPLVVDGFRTNQQDSEGHILFFDVEALIVQLLTEEYSAMSPGMEKVRLSNGSRLHCCGSGIRDPVLFALDPGWGKNPDPGSEIRCFLPWIRDGEKIRIRDEYRGFIFLEIRNHFLG
jgi:hypothetical protein